MLAFLNLSPTEIVIILVVAIVVFGRRLPEVAGQAAGALQRMRRSLDDLRRETGIDREIRNARRAFEDAVPRDVRSFDLRRKTREGIDKAVRAAEVGPAELPPVPPPAGDLPAAQASQAPAPGGGEGSPSPPATVGRDETPRAPPPTPEPGRVEDAAAESEEERPGAG